MQKLNEVDGEEELFNATHTRAHIEEETHAHTRSTTLYNRREWCGLPQKTTDKEGHQLHQLEHRKHKNSQV